MKNLGTRIKELRKEMGCTQIVLADVLGVTQDSISLWETGKRIPDTQYVIALCKFFDVSSDYLLGLTEELSVLSPENKGKIPYWLTPEEQKIIEEYRNINNSTKKPRFSAWFLYFISYLPIP